MYSSSSSSKPRPRLISISEAYRNLATLISQRDVPLKLSLNKDREVVSFIFTLGALAFLNSHQDYHSVDLKKSANQLIFPISEFFREDICFPPEIELLNISNIPFSNKIVD